MAASWPDWRCVDRTLALPDTPEIGSAQQDRPIPVKTPGEGRNQSRSATSALDVLEQFGQLRRPMRAVEFAAGDLPAAAAQRGLRVSMFGSAIGAAFLSSVDGAEVARLAHRARIPESEMPGLNAWLARVRSDGFADGPSAQGTIWSLAAPLPLARQNAPLVVGMAGAAELVRSNLPEYGELLRAAIARLES